MAVRLDNVGIVVEDLDAAIAFFTELGLTLEGRMTIEGEWAGRVTGVHGQRVEIAMVDSFAAGQDLKGLNHVADRIDGLPSVDGAFKQFQFHRHRGSRVQG